MKSSCPPEKRREENYSELTTSHTPQLQALFWNTGNRHSLGLIFLAFASWNIPKILSSSQNYLHYHSVRLSMVISLNDDWRPAIYSTSGQWLMRLPSIRHWEMKQPGLYTQHYYLTPPSSRTGSVRSFATYSIISISDPFISSSILFPREAHRSKASVCFIWHKNFINIYYKALRILL